jgi:hypothetical protein
MKIFNLGLSIDCGKYKYKDPCFEALVKKFSPKKATPYTVEFIDTDIEKSDAIVYHPDKKIDLIVIDLEKIENRFGRSPEQKEQDTLSAAKDILEAEGLLCDSAFSPEQDAIIRQLQLVTRKPCLDLDDAGDLNGLIARVLDKAGIILFFTIAKGELRAWSLKKGLSVLEAAGKIHSDLKRGFIKAEVVKAANIENFFNMAEAKARGFVEVVDKDYIVQPNDVIEIRFNV